METGRPGGTTGEWFSAGDPDQRETAACVLVSLAAGRGGPPAARRRGTAGRRCLRVAERNRGGAAGRDRRTAGRGGRFQVRTRLKDPQDEVRGAAERAAAQLGLNDDAGAKGPKIAELKFEDVLAAATKTPGDGGREPPSSSPGRAASPATPSRAAKPSRARCWRASPPVTAGPSWSNRFSSPAQDCPGLRDPVLRARRWQGARRLRRAESGEEVEVRSANAQTTLVAKNRIDERGRRELSIMPTGLVDPLTPADLASLLAYLESLKAK